MAGRLSGKVAIVTGGAGGIGQACAVKFAEEGADLVVSDIVPLDETASLVKRKGACVLAVAADVTSDADCDRLVSEAVAEYGRVDIGICAAGIATPSGPSSFHQVVAGQPVGHVVDLETEKFLSVLNINLLGTFRVNRALVRQMIRQGEGGAVVNISSMASKIAYPGGSHYCSSKAGVVMLSQALALEVADHGIRVNVVAPGFIDTPMLSGIRENAAARENLMNRIPLKRLGAASEVAQSCLFLCSDEADFYTGQVLCPSGGYGVG